MITRILAVFIFAAAALYSVTADDLELQLVQIVWRHGDRNPTDPYPGDQYDKKFWDGRGGYGQLTPRGMEMHVRLGAAIRQRYIPSFLSDSFNSEEIYIRSTDVNRTIISAISNMIGMYGQGKGSTPGKQYPNFTDTPQFSWPTNFVPVAVHTVDYNTDHLGNANADCPRQDAMWDLIKRKSPEFQRIKDLEMTKLVQKHLNESIHVWYEIDELWKVRDVLFIENDNGLNMPSWWSPKFHENLTAVNDMVEDLQDGIGVSPIDGLNFTVELPKLRTGALTNDMRMHMNLKLACIGQTTKNCAWINPLKYYVYSAHDETVSSFLASLGAKTQLVHKGYPLYASAAVIELWKSKSNNTAYFKLFYHSGDGENPPFKEFTNVVTGCPTNTHCPLEVFQTQADIYNPGDAVKLCHDTDFAKTNVGTKISGLIYMVGTLLFILLRLQ